MDKQLYIDAIQKQLEPNIFHHSLAVAACLSGIYEYLASQNQLGEEELKKEEWEIAGLIHDIDYSGVWKEEHPHKTREALEKYGLTISDPIFRMVQAHAAVHSGVEPKSKGEWAIYCSDSLTGLITAVAYVIPSRKLADVKVSSVVKRFLKEPKFAAGTRRDEVAKCSLPEGLAMPIEKFIEICLVSMQGIAPQLGL